MLHHWAWAGADMGALLLEPGINHSELVQSTELHEHLSYHISLI